MVGIIALVLQREQLLLLQHVYQDGWALPGGWLRRGEAIDSSIAREIREETGLSVQVQSTFDVANVVTKPVIDIVLVCSVASGEFTADNVEVANGAFFPWDELPDHILATHLPYIRAFLSTVREGG